MRTKLLLRLISVVLGVSLAMPVFGQWYTVDNDPTPNQPPGRLMFPNKDTGYVFANTTNSPCLSVCVAMRKTTDGGNTWALSYIQYAGSEVLHNMGDVQFVTGNIGYAISQIETSQGDSGCIIKTIDGGQTWSLCFEATPTLDPGFYGSLFFVNKDTGYVNTMNGKVMKTTDGGVTWSSYATLNTGPNYDHDEDVWFNTASTGVILSGNQYFCCGFPSATAPGMIQRTTNGGLNWSVVLTDTGFNFRKVFFSSATVGYVLADSLPSGQGGPGKTVILRTTDGGATWAKKGTLAGASGASIFFVSDSIGYLGTFYNASSSIPSLYRTMDAGNTWIPMVYPGNNTGIFPALFFTDYNTGYAVDHNSSVCCFPIYKLMIGDSVWPGDCNSDLVADNNDLLNIGLLYGNTGNARSGASNSWTGQFCTDWQFNAAANDKHADCNGDGTIDLNDTLAISLNYGMTHSLRVIQPQIVQASNADVSLQFNKPIYFGGDTVLADIHIGSATNVQSNFYGAAFTINYDNSKVKPGTETIYFSNSWIGNVNQTMAKLGKMLPGQGQADAALVRFTHTDTSGFGRVGTLRFILKDTLTTAYMYLTVSDAMMINENGVESNLTAGTDSVALAQTTGTTNSVSGKRFLVFPNPSSGMINICAESPLGDIRITDLLGETVYKANATQNTVQVDLSAFARGMYILQIQDRSYRLIKQ